MKKTINMPWVFWIEITKRKGIKPTWFNRGSNFLEIHIFAICLSIGAPWHINVIKYHNEKQILEQIEDCNKRNLIYRFSFLMNGKMTIK